MARAGTRVPDRRCARHYSGLDLPSGSDLPDRLSPGGARPGDWVVRSICLRPGQLFRTVETGPGRRPEAVGHLQRPEFRRALRSAGHRRLYRTIPGADDAETLAAHGIITSGKFNAHSIVAGRVRFVSGHRFSDDPKTSQKAAFRRWG